MYTQHMLCPDLAPRQLCFRSFQYREGEISELFHEHVPAHRMAHATALEAARALISTQAGWSSSFVLRSLLNGARGDPEAYPGFLIRVEYPEVGAIRYHASSGDNWAWFDKVIDREAFRP